MLNQFTVTLFAALVAVINSLLFLWLSRMQKSLDDHKKIFSQELKSLDCEMDALRSNYISRFDKIYNRITESNDNLLSKLSNIEHRLIVLQTVIKIKTNYLNPISDDENERTEA